MRRALAAAALAAALLITANAGESGLYDAVEGSRLDAADRRLLSDLEKSGRKSIPGGAWRPGEVVFEYGTGHHSVVCAVLELCDIALEPGEQILDAQIGDSARWYVDTASSGSGSQQVSHLVVKPLAAGIRTSLVVTTDRRAYHLRLKASADKYMPSVRFNYPGSNLSAIGRKRSIVNKPLPSPSRAPVDIGGSASAPETAAETSAAPADADDADHGGSSYSYSLDFDFDVNGDEEVMPERVYFDGKRTIVQMAKDTKRMPALLLGGENNYRVNGSNFIVDGMIARAALVITMGGNEYRAEISHFG